MPKKDVCYVTTDDLEPNSEWSEIERGIKNPQNPKMKFAIKTMVVAKTKLKPSVKKEYRLVIIKKNNRNYIEMLPKYIPPETQ